jgi:hypothetical protein
MLYGLSLPRCAAHDRKPLSTLAVCGFTKKPDERAVFHWPRHMENGNLGLCPSWTPSAVQSLQPGDITPHVEEWHLCTFSGVDLTNLKAVNGEYAHSHSLFQKFFLGQRRPLCSFVGPQRDHSIVFPPQNPLFSTPSTPSLRAGEELAEERLNRATGLSCLFFACLLPCRSGGFEPYVLFTYFDSKIFDGSNSSWKTSCSAEPALPLPG